MDPLGWRTYGQVIVFLGKHPFPDSNIPLDLIFISTDRASPFVTGIVEDSIIFAVGAVGYSSTLHDGSTGQIIGKEVQTSTGSARTLEAAYFQ